MDRPYRSWFDSMSIGYSTQPRLSKGRLSTARESRGPWTTALVMIALVLLSRIIYLKWFCPYELLGDEAYYWDEARHLDWCYNEKGPALAWMIAGCCRLLGDTEFAVRVPVLLSFILGAWGVGRLAIAVARG